MDIELKPGQSIWHKHPSTKKWHSNVVNRKVSEHNSSSIEYKTSATFRRNRNHSWAWVANMVQRHCTAYSFMGLSPTNVFVHINKCVDWKGSAAPLPEVLNRGINAPPPKWSYVLQKIVKKKLKKEMEITWNRGWSLQSANRILILSDSIWHHHTDNWF